MSQYRDLIARMAVDAEFAVHARAHPDEVAAQYGLTPDETQQLRGLADAAASAGPIALGARLSKSGISTGLLTGFVVAQPDVVNTGEVYKPAFDPLAPSGFLDDILGNNGLEVIDDPYEPPKPPFELPDHIGPIDLVWVPDFPDEEPPPTPPPADPVTPPAPVPPPPPMDPVSQPPATPAAAASPVTDVTSPAGGGIGGGEAGEPLQVGAPTTDTPGGVATPPGTVAAATGSDSGIGATEIAIGGAVLVTGAVAGGVVGALAGKSLGSSAAHPDDEKTIQGLGPAIA
jgi:hypothetical protein